MLKFHSVSANGMIVRNPNVGLVFYDHPVNICIHTCTHTQTHIYADLSSKSRMFKLVKSCEGLNIFFLPFIIYNKRLVCSSVLDENDLGKINFLCDLVPFTLKRKTKALGLNERIAYSRNFIRN